MSNPKGRPEGNPHRPNQLTGIAIGKIRKLLRDGQTHEQVAVIMRVSVADVEAVEV